uniref:CCHC-type domain-containing protein n=1 Tax=Tanacetum cinerariifolium TaxID=118510 RepID=A0A6L2LDZ4_TANCI|nr:hypothetical protein [Tanacetum cinerariifolium]
MEKYMSKTRAKYGSRIARPKIDDKDSFELKGQFLKELRDNTFSGSDYEDANEHIERVLEIVDLFHIPNITGAEVILFYNRLDVQTRQILDSKGAIPSKTVGDAKVAIQEMVECSQKWHNGTSRTRGCKQCKGPHYTKDCPLKEEGKTIEEAYYSQFGASVSVMPLSTYLNLGLGELAHTKLTVELTDRTVKHPKGIFRKVLVGIGKFVIPSLGEIKLMIGCPPLRKVSLEDMDAYRDEGMGDVIFGEPFLREVRINARWFEGLITIYNGNEEVTYQMVRSHLRFKSHTNEQCNKIPSLLKVCSMLDDVLPSHRLVAPASVRGKIHSIMLSPKIPENGMIRTKKYAKLSDAEKIQADCDMKATNVILQDSGFAVPIFSPGDDLIACLNKAMAFLTAVASSRQARVVKCYNCQGEGHMARQCTQHKQPRNAVWYKEKAMLAEANEVGQILDEEQLTFLADPGIPTEVPNSKTYPNDMDNQSYQNPFYLKKAQRIKPTLYDGIVTSEKHVAMPIIDDEETLILEEESRLKMSEKTKDPEVIAKKISHKPIDYEKLNRLIDDFGKCFTPQQVLLAEQAFWLRISNPTIESSLPPVIVEVPSELPKVSLVNVSLKKLKFQLTQFDSVMKKRTTPNALTEDIVSTVMNCMSLNVDCTYVGIQRSESCAKCLNLDAEFSKSKQAYNDLLKKYSQLEKHCISFEVSMQLKQEVFQNNESCVYQNAPKILEYFKKNNLKAQLKDKYTTICKFKDTIKSLRKNNKEEIVDHDACDIETINEELENSVAKLLSKNELEQAKAIQPLDSALDFACKHAKRIQELLVYVRDTCPSAVKLSETKVVQIVLWYLDSECSKHMTWNCSQLINVVSKFLGTVRFENGQIARIMGYGDYQLENVIILRDLGKIDAKADIGIFVGYAPVKKAFRIYNRRTWVIFEIVLVTFNELTAMTSEQFSSGPGLHIMTPATPSFEESPKTQAFYDDTLNESLQDSTSQGSSSNVIQIHTQFEHLGRWTKDHLIANVIGDPSRSISTRKQLETDAMWCYIDAFLTSVEPKNFKQAMNKTSWMDAMQEEIHKFERLEVWELVPCAVDPTLFTWHAGNDLLLSKYASEIVKKYGLNSTDPVDVPMIKNKKLDEDIQGKPVDATLYRRMIGSLMYLTASRPDVNYVVCLCARIMSFINAQQTKLDLELVPKENRLDISKCNGRIPSGLTPREPIFQVVLDAIALTPCYTAFLITADVPEVYMHQCINPGELFPLLSIKFYPERPAVLTSFVSPELKSFEMYGAILPECLTSPAMKESKAYKTYLDYATGAVPPKLARKFKKTSPSKKDNNLVPINKGPIMKDKRVNRSVKKSSTKPTTGIVIIEPPVENKSKRKEKVDVTHGKESWGNDEDDNNDDNDSENKGNENKSDDDKTPSNSEKDSDYEQDTDGSESYSKYDQQEYEEDVKDDDDDDKFEGDKDRGMDDTTNQFSDDDQDKKADESEVPDANVSHSSDLASKFLNFLDIHPNDAEIISPLDVHVHHEIPRIHTSTLLTVPVSVIPEASHDKDEVPFARSDQEFKKRKTSKDSEPTTSSKNKDSTSRSSKGTKSQPKSSGKTIHSEEPKFKVGDTNTPQGHEGNLDKTPQKRLTQNWLLTLAASTFTDKSLKDFDELMNTLIHFSLYILNGLKIKNMTQEILLGPAFRLLKGTCSNYVELDYDFKECYKALLEKLDWENPESGDYPFDLSKLLPLITCGNRQSVPIEFFINNDLKYLQRGILTMTYTTSTTKTKSAQYDLPSIVDMVPNI